MVGVRLRILLFGRISDALGRQIETAIPETGCTVGELRRLVVDQTSSEVLLQKGVRASVDKQVVGDDAMVRPDSEVAFFSVFSGG
ncbi:MAG TPA: MoaD/ThiS family protein [Caulobacteraceae bacterium]